MGRPIRKRAASYATIVDCNSDRASARLRADLCMLQFVAQHAYDHLQHSNRARRQHNFSSHFRISFERPGHRRIHRRLWHCSAKRHGHGLLHKQAARSRHGAARSSHHRRERAAARGTVERLDRQHQPDSIYYFFRHRRRNRKAARDRRGWRTSHAPNQNRSFAHDL